MKNNTDIFSEIYHTNFWGDKDSVSGTGSNMAATEVIRRELPLIIKRLGVNSILDIPCGDYHWMPDALKDLDVKYFGADIVPELIYKLAGEHDPSKGRLFVVRDAAVDGLPPVDLIFCRDMLGHLTNADIKRVLKNFRRSGSVYLMATTFPMHDNANEDIQTGQWRPLNLEDWRLGLGEPIAMVLEGGEGDLTKSMGIWRL